MKSILTFARRLYQCREIIRAMALREIQRRYAGTFAGFVWSIIHPLAMILIYWFVFSYGLKVQPVGGVDFVVSFVCALAPWLFLSETLGAGVNAVVGNPSLVKRVVFPTEILPVVTLAASLIGHAVVLVILAVFVAAHGIAPALANVQFFYYTAGLAVFSLGLTWLLAAVNVFYRDTGQVVAVVLNMWFWLTPIVWPLTMLPERYRFFFKLNPIYYIVQGYRDSFVHHVPFWVHWRLGLYFWAVALAALALGAIVFRRLKRQFADVL